jgi:hypothetical protein
MFLRMNHQIDAVEWPPFDQKRLLRFAPGIPSCLLTRPGLLQPTRGASLTSMLRIDDFVEFQNMFLRMNHQIDATEWPPFDQKTFQAWHSILYISPSELAAIDQRSFVDAHAKN